jgi:chemotaxis protein histidine kinase CheA
MTREDLIRKRIDLLLRDVREQHEHALATLADGLVESVQEQFDELRRIVEQERSADEQARIAAVEREASARLTQVQEEADARLAESQASAAQRLAQAEADAAQRLTHSETDAAQRLAKAEAEAAERLSSSEAEAAQRLARVEAESATRADAVRAELIGEIERIRTELSSEVERTRSELASQVDEVRAEADAHVAAAEARALTAEARATVAERERDLTLAENDRSKSGMDLEVVASERELDLAALDRLLDGFRALDAARTLTEILDALTVRAAREAARVALLLVQGDRLRGWRTAGFESVGNGAPSLDLDLAEGGIVTRALRSGGRATTSDREGTSTPGTIAPPSFAGLGHDRVGLAVPLIVGNQVVAVLYADDVNDAAPRLPGAWPEAIEMLARHASRCLESVTAARTVSAVTLARRSKAGDTGATPDDAARYAKLLISEIKLYHEGAVEQGRRASDLRERLAPEIARARRLYEERIGPEVRGRYDYFDQELVRTLADGNPTLLGSMKASPTS